MPPHTNERLAHVWWLGGSPCAGKSSVAQLLAEQHGLRLYRVDDAFPRQRPHFTPQDQPILYKWTHRTWDELWMEPVDVLLPEAIAGYTEHFQCILQDLVALPTSEPVLAEGTALLPPCVAPWLAKRHQGVWLVPSEGFQRRHYARRRDFVQGILSQCQDPERAWQHWMERDARFARWVAQQTRQSGLELLVVDGQRTITQCAASVAAHFRL